MATSSLDPNVTRLGSNPLEKLQELTEGYNEPKGRQYQWSHKVADLRPADNSSRLLSYSTKGPSRFNLSQNQEVAFFDETLWTPSLRRGKGVEFIIQKVFGAGSKVML